MSHTQRKKSTILQTKVITLVFNWSVQVVGKEGEEGDNKRSSSKFHEIWRNIFVKHQSLLYIWSDLNMAGQVPSMRHLLDPKLKLNLWPNTSKNIDIYNPKWKKGRFNDASFDPKQMLPATSAQKLNEP